jgi:hypothetical protein
MERKICVWNYVVVVDMYETHINTIRSQMLSVATELWLAHYSHVSSKKRSHNLERKNMELKEDFSF